LQHAHDDRRLPSVTSTRTKLSLRLTTTFDIEADGSVSRVSLSKVDPERSEFRSVNGDIQGF